MARQMQNFNSLNQRNYLGRFVVPLNNAQLNNIVTSDDGITWTSRNSAVANNILGIGYSHRYGLVAVGNVGAANTRVQLSTNGGLNWATQSYPNNNNWVFCVWAEELELFVAIAQSGVGNRVMTSPNGRTWTSRTSAGDRLWTCVSWSGSRFVAIAYDGTVGQKVMWSDNAITWTAATASLAIQWLSNTYSKKLGLWVAVSDGPAANANRVMTSPNGITWTTRTALQMNWVSVCYSEEKQLFVAVAYGGATRVMTSTDGITWTGRTAATLEAWQEVVWSSQLNVFIAMANNNVTNRVMVSSDGITWTIRAGLNNGLWYKMIYAGKGDNPYVSYI